MVYVLQKSTKKVFTYHPSMIRDKKLLSYTMFWAKKHAREKPKV